MLLMRKRLSVFMELLVASKITIKEVMSVIHVRNPAGEEKKKNPIKKKKKNKNISK